MYDALEMMEALTEDGCNTLFKVAEIKTDRIRCIEYPVEITNIN